MAFLYSPILPAAADLLSTPTPSTSGYIKTWDGTQWAYKPMLYWDGVQWVKKPVKAWDGTKWAQWNGSAWNGAHIDPGAGTGTSTYWMTLTNYGSTFGFTVTDIDTTGNAYATGFIDSAGLRYPYMCKYDSTGLVVWQKSISEIAGGNLIRMEVTANSMYVTLNQDLQEPICKYNLNGALQWAKTPPSYISIWDIASDPGDSNIYITGTSAPVAETTCLVVKIDPAGAIIWQTTIGYGSANDYMKGWRCSADSSGNVYVIGEFYDSTAFWIGRFLAKFNASGVFQWCKDVNNIEDVACDNSGNIYIIYDSTCISKLDSSGAVLWTRSLGIQLYELKCDPTGNNVYAIGTGSHIIKYSSSGVLQWQRELASGGAHNLSGLAVDSAGNAYASGYDSSSILTIKIPADGSFTGTYGGIAYQASTLTETQPSWTPFTLTPTATAINISLTTITVSDTTQTLYWMSAAIPQ